MKWRRRNEGCEGGGEGGSTEPNEEEREGKKVLEGIMKKSGGEEWRKLGS